MGALAVLFALLRYRRSLGHLAGGSITLSPQGTPERLAHADTIVVFDNNVYRDLTTGMAPAEVDGAVQILTDAERRNRIQALAQPIILMELAARLSDRHPETQRRVRSALTAAALHTRFEVQGQPAVGAMPDPETIISMAVFQDAPLNNRQISELLTSLCRHVESVRAGRLNRRARRLVKFLSKHVRTTEAAFVEDLFEYVVKPFNPALNSWEELEKRPDLAAPALKFLRGPDSRVQFARMQVLRAADNLDRTISPEELDLKANDLVQHLGVAISLYNEIVQRVIVQGCRLTRKNRENWVWDLHLALCVGASHSIAGRQVLLITTDGDILAAAEAAQCRDLVRSFAEYKQALGVP